MMKFLMYIPVFLLSGIVRAFTLKMLWAWFVLTQWTHAPNPGMLGFLGLTTFIGALTLQVPSEVESKQNDDLTKMYVQENAVAISMGNNWSAYDRGMNRMFSVSGTVIFHSLIMLFVGWVYHWLQMHF